MTSLQKQLELLKAPQTDEYIQSKYKESFLYNKQDAAAIDCDTHLRVANKGFEKLLESDQDLEDYRDLFNEYSKEIERAVLTEEQNQELSTRLRKFINNTIVPYFMLNACHETLEYLVYKYKVNTYQMDDLLAALIPYHDTRLFARALQMIPGLKKRKGVWDWLVVYQKEGLPVPKEKILAVLSGKQTSGLLSTLGDKLLEINRDCKNTTHASIYTSFFATTVMAAMNRNTSDEFLGLLFAHVLKGMRKAYSLDLYMFGLTLSGYLAYQMSIEETFIVQLMDRMTKSHMKMLTKHPDKKNHLDENYLKVIAIITANQNDVELTDAAKDALARINIDKYHEMFDCSSVVAQLGHVIEMDD